MSGLALAIIGSRTAVNIDIGAHIPPDTSLIISGGARGADTCAANYARAHGIELLEIRPDYAHHPGRIAPLLRNRQIVDAADMVLAFWDGQSHGTKYTINYAQSKGVPVVIVPI